MLDTTSRIWGNVGNQSQDWNRWKRIGLQPSTDISHESLLLSREWSHIRLVSRCNILWIFSVICSSWELTRPLFTISALLMVQIKEAPFRGLVSFFYLRRVAEYFSKEFGNAVFGEIFKAFRHYGSRHSWQLHARAHLNFLSATQSLAVRKRDITSPRGKSLLCVYTVVLGLSSRGIPGPSMASFPLPWWSM